MTLSALLTALITQDALPAKRLKDLKTSIKYLSAALGADSPNDCQVDTTVLAEATWGEPLEDHFTTLEQTQGRTISAITRRNTRANVRLLARLAASHGLLTTPLPPPIPVRPRSTRRAFHDTRGTTNLYPATYGHRKQYFSLPQAQWPVDIVQGWEHYRAACGLRLRETTVQTYVRILQPYFGYFAHIVGRPPTWDDLFTVASLEAFVRWHGQRHETRVTALGLKLATFVAAAAKVLDHPHRHALATFRNNLPMPALVHQKRLHWVSLAELEAVAESCLTQGRKPTVSDHRFHHPGVQRAGRFQCGVMLKLLTRIPLRQRNIREMQVGKNLMQDPTTGEWHLEFRGPELKIDTRGARPNEYKVNLSTYCPELLPVLQEWLTVYRPKFPSADTSPYVFLTQFGTPHNANSIHTNLSATVGIHTGRRFYPHMIRTIWATEYLTATQDFATAATMLGDTVQTVLKRYYDIVHADQHKKAKTFLASALRVG